MKYDYIARGGCVELMKDMPTDCVDVVFTSPPYNRIRNDTYAFYNDNLVDYYSLLEGFTKESLRIAKDKVIVNIQQNHFNKKEFFKYLGEFAENIAGVVIWEKTNPQPGNNYHEDDNTRSVTNAFEYFIFMSKDGSKFRAYGKAPVKNVITTSVNSKHIEGHGAIMKQEVCEWFIDKFTKEGDIVLDPFLGTGTTAVVAHALGRHYIGFEITQEYFEIAQRRIYSAQLDELLGGD